MSAEINLEIGSEERFLDFVGRIRGKKTVLISHTDLDGITCAKIVNSAINLEKIYFLDYDKVNSDLAKELKKECFEKVITTDLYVKEDFVRELEKFAEVLIIDHHRSPDWNSKKTVFIKGEDGYSAGYLCYGLFSKIKEITKLDWIVACSCISDYCHVRPKEWLSNIMEKYGDSLKYVRDYVRQSGEFWDLQYLISLALVYFKENPKKVYEQIGNAFGDVGNLKKYYEEVQSEVERVCGLFREKKEPFKEGYLFVFDSKFQIASLVSSILSSEEIHKTYVFIIPKRDFYKISVRQQDKKFNCDKFLRDLLSGLEGADGGGHIPAAGGHFQKKDLPEVRRRLGLK